MEQEFYEFGDKEGLPTMFQEDSEFGSMLGCLDNEGLLQYKVSRHGDINRTDAEAWIRHRIPSKAEDILKNSQIFQARWCFRKGKHFVYETKNGVHYTYGFRGNGFFYMPLHGKVVFDTLLKKGPLKYALI